ncbi:MAG TPA: SAM-dependent chlorinase/fluorinase [Thermoplasmata archaeon]|nr:SAM-dependent chlorinase/fluorinase [Thermoplasmata archaeon]
MIITLTTDFGLGTYVASMKGVILEIDPEAKVVDVDHSVAPQDVRQGAYALFSASSWFPFAIHIGVVDPGVGTERRGIAIACEGAMFVGPDNGLLIPAAEAFGIKEVHHITNKEYTLRRASYVFHGRDIFAPVAAHLSKGVKLKEIGPAISDYVKLDFGTPVVNAAGIEGEVLTIDRFGNIITNIPRGVVSERWRFNQDLEVSIGGYDIRVRLLRTYGEASEDAILATMSSSNFLEIAKRNGNAAAIVNARPRMPVILRAAP